MDHSVLQTTTIDDLTDHAWLKLSSATSFLPKRRRQRQVPEARAGDTGVHMRGRPLIQGVNHAKLKGFGHPSLDGPIKVQMEVC